jgi:phage tail sheath protein FI
LVVPISAGTETLPTDPDDINLDPQKKLVTDAAAADTVLDQVDLFNLLCVPGLTESAAQGQLSAFCKYRRAMLIADCRSDDQINGLQTGPPPVTEPRHASFYFPWLKAADDLAQGRITDFPPCGYMAGLYARTDSSRGVWKAPAGLRLNIGAFMHDLFRQGAFQGRTPRDAYFVKCDKETTPQNDINRGIVNILVGFAPLKPAEFVVIQLTQIAGQIET